MDLFKKEPIILTEGQKHLLDQLKEKAQDMANFYESIYSYTESTTTKAAVESECMDDLERALLKLRESVLWAEQALQYNLITSL